MNQFKPQGRSLPEFPDYVVTKYGTVYSFKSNTWLLPHRYKKHYPKVQLYNEGELTNFYLHELVAKLWLSNPKGLPQVNHIDGNKANNHVDNLEWCTKKYNSRHYHWVLLNKKTKLRTLVEKTGCLDG